ncbi:MAG: hypothetical protein GXY83_01725 [Rhodopirellula sp.]|nr:hypothetical protein [Rhodopirellula sp.]
MSVSTTQGENRVVLSQVTWATYAALLTETDRAGTRFTYDRGLLEIMAPSREHERIKTLLGRMIEMLTVPFLPIKEVERFLQQRRTTDETTLMRDFLAWVRTLPVR